MKRDPVCNMKLGEDASVQTTCAGITYYFCSEGCRDKFLKNRTCPAPRASYDTIIVGGGPAGLTAAVYASTLKMEGLLISEDLGGQAVDSTKINNYMGFDFITGPELVEKFRHQFLNYHYIDHFMSRVEKIEARHSEFRVFTSDINEFLSRSLIIATGMTRRKLGVPGEDRFQRKGVFYGNIQDLSFVHGRDVAVIGGGNSAVQNVQNLRTVAGMIYLICDSTLTADPMEIDKIVHMPNLKIFEGYKVEEIQGDDTLSSIRIKKMNSEKALDLKVQGVFVAIGLIPNSELISRFTGSNSKGEVIIHSDCSTSWPGIFAAGDVTNSYGKRIIIASGEGAKAAMAAKQYVLNMHHKNVLLKSNPPAGLKKPDEKHIGAFKSV